MDMVRSRTPISQHHGSSRAFPRGMAELSSGTRKLATATSSSQIFIAWEHWPSETYHSQLTPPTVLYTINTLRFWVVAVVGATPWSVHSIPAFLHVCLSFIFSFDTSSQGSRTKPCVLKGGDWRKSKTKWWEKWKTQGVQQKVQWEAPPV